VILTRTNANMQCTLASFLIVSVLDTIFVAT